MTLDAAFKIIPWVWRLVEARRKTRTARVITVLLVDDDPLNRDLFISVARQYHAMIIEARNGQEAMAILSTRGSIDFLVTDVHMPGMDGLAVIEHVMRMPFMQRPGVVVWTSFDNGALLKIKQFGIALLLAKTDNSFTSPIEFLFEKWVRAKRV